MEEKIIDLPALPQKWDMLSGEQMAELNRIRHRCAGSEPEYLFHAFCYLLGIKICKKVQENSDGTFTYLFRRVNRKEKKYGEHIPLQNWQIQYYINTMLKWLTEDCDRLNDVFPKINLVGKNFSSPGYAMTGMTYQQHQYAQRFLQEYYRISKILYEKSKQTSNTHITTLNNAFLKEIKLLLQKQEQVRRRLMATIFTPETMVTDKLVDGKQVHYDPPQRDFIFSTDQIEREAWRFRYFSEFKSEAVIQQFSGVMQHYKKIFPLLFKEGEGGATDLIDAEQSTMNILQSKLHFNNYQAIYDSNAPFILGQLHFIMKEAKSIDEANARLKRKKK